mmetsp:Transcript_3356/g.9366  ORF Transcript_3356/g.9366 Transcript_3356/m.9366 type:complete len:240 (-) Transcript_3356:199-918(-)
MPEAPQQLEEESSPIAGANLEVVFHASLMADQDFKRRRDVRKASRLEACQAPTVHGWVEEAEEQLASERKHVGRQVHRLAVQPHAIVRNTQQPAAVVAKPYHCARGHHHAGAFLALLLVPRVAAISIARRLTWRVNSRATICHQRRRRNCCRHVHAFGKRLKRKLLALCKLGEKASKPAVHLLPKVQAILPAARKLPSRRQAISTRPEPPESQQVDKVEPIIGVHDRLAHCGAGRTLER